MCGNFLLKVSVNVCVGGVYRAVCFGKYNKSSYRKG